MGVRNIMKIEVDPAKDEANIAKHGVSLRVAAGRSEEHTSELQSLMRNSYAVFCLKKKTLDNYVTTLDRQNILLQHTTIHITINVATILSHIALLRSNNPQVIVIYT